MFIIIVSKNKNTFNKGFTVYGKFKSRLDAELYAKDNFKGKLWKVNVINQK